MQLDGDGTFYCEVLIKRDRCNYMFVILKAKNKSNTIVTVIQLTRWNTDNCLESYSLPPQITFIFFPENLPEF